jgi:hypothetical protein
MIFPREVGVDGSGTKAARPQSFQVSDRATLISAGAVDFALLLARDMLRQPSVGKRASALLR